MPISYTDITYVQNGQAINAANLNAPSVDLEARSVEAKRDSDQSRFSADHTTDSKVVLVSDEPSEANITIRTRLREDGSAASNLVKYYMPEFTNMQFSIYSKAVHGGRYIIPGSAVGSVYADSINGSNPVLATALSVPGDGIYAKIPLRHTVADPALTNYPDLVYPKTKAQSLGSQYLSEGLTAELVKLPELVVMDLLSTLPGDNVSSFMSRLTTQFTDIDTSSVGNDGALSLTNANGVALGLKVLGTQEGAECEVSHILERQDDQPGLQFIFTRSSSPIYIEHNQRVNTALLQLGIYASGILVGVASAVPITLGSYSGYYILPRLLDPNYSYVPLIRLTENSIIIADRAISLSKRQLANGETINLHGDPMLGVPPAFTAEESVEYKVNTLSDNTIDKAYKGIHTIVAGIAQPVTLAGVTFVQLDHSLSPELLLLKRNLQVGDKLSIVAVRASVIEQCTSQTGNTNTVGCTVSLLLGVGEAYVESASAAVTLPSNSFDVGNKLELFPEGDNSYSYTQGDSAATQPLEFSFYVEENAVGQSLIAGKVYVEFDLAVF
jgi:hypothetical protein